MAREGGLPAVEVPVCAKQSKCTLQGRLSRQLDETLDRQAGWAQRRQLPVPCQADRG